MARPAAQLACCDPSRAADRLSAANICRPIILESLHASLHENQTRPNGVHASASSQCPQTCVGMHNSINLYLEKRQQHLKSI